ncbi:hypothetical protein MJO28_007293 [Puccinia striiformis f. sp. tritici]|uniref:Uncharacterized protein n=1 Tax=Puccinia striiformis f. sp. tritici TaxID=168172 RepID=A0ACC0EE12_9BASI|nr:hypothetical protein MJO28_007293 [Puccinia striiformis f. sp. tritici]
MSGQSSSRGKQDPNNGNGKQNENEDEIEDEHENENEQTTRPFVLNPSSHYHPNYPISTVMNQVSSQNITLTAFNAIRSSIPINLKPPPLSSFVKLPYGQSQSVLAPSNKRSAPSPIKLSRSPTIPLSDFDSYLEQVQVQYDRWQTNLTTNSKVIKSLQSNSTTELIANQSNHSDPPSNSTPTLPSLSSVPHVFFDQKFSLNDPSTFDLLTQQPSPSSPAISTSESDRHTSNQAPKPSASSTHNTTDLTTDHIIIDKLSHYLDLIELHLVQEISLRSSSFFSALGNLQSLHAQTSSSVAQIAALKNQLEQLKRTVSDKALTIIRYGIRRRNITSIELALNKLNEVWQTVHGIEELIQSGEWQSALGLIQELEQLWQSSTVLSSTSPHHMTDSDHVSPPDRPIKLRLSKLKALAALPKRLSVFRTTISKALVAELSSILSHDLKVNLIEFASIHSLDQTESKDLNSNSPTHSSSSTSNQNGGPQIRDHIKSRAQERLRERVRPTFDGLIRAGGMEKALAAWRESVVKQIREIVKNGLTDVIEGDLDDRDDSSDISQFNSKDKRNGLSEKTMTLARNLKALKHREFLKIAQTAYRDLLGCLELVDTQSKALLELAEQLKTQTNHPVPSQSDQLTDAPLDSNTARNEPPDVESVNESNQSNTITTIDLEGFQLKLTEVVQSTAELANSRFAKVIGVRTEIHSQLNFIEFFSIFDSSWKFVVQCETISRRMIIALRGVMVNQAKSFLLTFHQNKITESAKIVEMELWSPVDVPYQIQLIVNSIISSAMEDPKKLIIDYQKLQEDQEQVNDESSSSNPSPSKLLEIEGNFYHPVSASLQTLKTISEYLQIIINCSLLTTDLMGKIIEFLKAFNSRTCQVVLGAGAIRSAGLKNITAKHLALASQALSTMISLIPYIRECLRRHLNMKQAVMLIDFDKLKRDYQEHQNEVHSKLISIMADRLGVHKQTLESIDWDSSSLDNSKDEKDELGANPYLESLLKEVGTLHRVLGRYLPSSTLQDILSQVFMSIHGALEEEFNQVEIKSIEGKRRILRDAEYFSNKLIELKATEDCQSKGRALIELIHTRFFPELLKGGGTTKANSGGGGSSSTDIKSPDPTQVILPPSPITERTGSFRDKFRFLSTRAKAVDSSGSLLAEVTNAALATPTTSSLIGGETSPTRGVSPVGSGAGVETGADGDKSTVKLDDDSKPIGSKDESDEQPNSTQNIESTSTSSAPDSKSVETSVAPVPSSKEDPPLPNSSSSTASLSSKPLKLTLSQRLAALASSRRGSHSSIITNTTSSPVQNGPPTIPEHLPTEGSELTPTLRVTTNSPPEDDQAKTVQDSRESGYLNFDTIPLSPIGSNAGVESSKATGMSSASQEKAKEDSSREEVSSPSQMKAQQYSSTGICKTDQRPESTTTLSQDITSPLSPTPQPIKPTLSQRLAALASLRRGSQSSSLAPSPIQTGQTTIPDPLPKESAPINISTNQEQPDRGTQLSPDRHPLPLDSVHSDIPTSLADNEEEDETVESIEIKQEEEEEEEEEEEGAHEGGGEELVTMENESENRDGNEAEKVEEKGEGESVEIEMELEDEIVGEENVEDDTEVVNVIETAVEEEELEKQSVGVNEEKKEDEKGGEEVAKEEAAEEEEDRKVAEVVEEEAAETAAEDQKVGDEKVQGKVVEEAEEEERENGDGDGDGDGEEEKGEEGEVGEKEVEEKEVKKGKEQEDVVVDPPPTKAPLKERLAALAAARKGSHPSSSST